MVKKIKRYTASFKKESISYVLNAVSVSQAAKDLGIPDATLHNWVLKAKKAGEDVSPYTGEKVNVGELISENQELKKRLARLEQEKALLKKAAVYFAQDQG